MYYIYIYLDNILKNKQKQVNNLKIKVKHKSYIFIVHLLFS